ncbi:MAG: hypothetical protein B6U87_02310 [Candidatus Aenigmarchaeota archaeon ex4484_52]|nr:MAG: hypothetical protein B6U87_02310 [Candidatus Aenigmarchaeota archaeon ex4484_52]
MKTYNKGYVFEQAVKSKLETDGWMVIRSAGSKKPDLIAARNKKIIIIECKSTKQDIIYFDEKEVKNLKKTASEFGAECLFAVKKNHLKNWFLVGLEALEKTKNKFKILLD